MAGEGIIQLYSGRMFNVRQPRAQDIIFEDIATSLSRLARFNGHSLSFYSVAQHSVLVAILVPFICETWPEPITEEDVLNCQRVALMHDAHEAYIGDIPRPLKMFCKGLWDLVPAIDAAIAARFGLVGPEQHKAIVKAADRLALAIERRDLLGHQLNWEDNPGEPVHWLSVTACKSFEHVYMFRHTFDRLFGAAQDLGPLRVWQASSVIPASIPTHFRVDGKPSPEVKA